MRFLLTEDQQALADAVDEVITGAGGVDIAQRWATGDAKPGLRMWQQLTELGLMGLMVPEPLGGQGAGRVELVAICERLGHHGVPGPLIESLALLPGLLDAGALDRLTNGVPMTAHVPGVVAAADGSLASEHFVIDGAAISAATPGAAIESLAPTRRLYPLQPIGTPRPLKPQSISTALDDASLAAAALLLGAGERLLAEAVGYAMVRRQFGRQIGEFQGLKHQLADVRVALSFARPLLWNAAMLGDRSLSAGVSSAGVPKGGVPSGGARGAEAIGENYARATSAAKVATSAAADLAARTSLQVHGAIGYTTEHPLRIWLGLVPALVQAWGTPAFHRARIARWLLAAADDGTVGAT